VELAKNSLAQTREVQAFNGQIPNLGKVEHLEKKIEDKNEQLAKMLMQKSVDSKELQELKYKLEKEQRLSEKMTEENDQFRVKI